MNLQPYQEASEEMIRQSNAPGKAATDIGLSIIGGGAILKKIVPFFNKFIPQDLAIKGLSKVNPDLGKFINGSLKQGNPIDEILSFIKDKISDKKPEIPKQNQNIISQYSDKLHAFIENQIKQGRSPLEAGAIARTNKEFNSSISKMEKDHKTPFSSIIESTYGSSQKGSVPQQMQQQQSAPQASNPNDSLLAALDKILKM